MGARRAAGVLLALGSVAGAFAWRRLSQSRREHVDLYFDDGSMISFAEGSPEAERLLPLAGDVLSAARG